MIKINMLKPKASFYTPMPMTYYTALFMCQTKAINDVVVEINKIHERTLTNTWKYSI
jgi:hypothetical protein